MLNNLKTLSFFVVLAALCAVQYASPKILKGKKVVHEESENARELYTGKTLAVYNPLDTAYVVTDELKRLILNEKKQNYSHFKKWPVLSVWVDPKDLYDDTRGILANQNKRGRLWERASHINYYEHGSLLYSSFAGVRVHGGASRGRAGNSFRFYFRKSYGESSFLKNLDISLKDGSPLKQLVLRKDTQLNFANDISYSIIRELGGMAPKLKHVAVYLNGQFYQYMQMQEHLHEKQAKYLFGHERFLFYKLKGSNPTRDRLLYENAIHIVKGSGKPIAFKKMDSMFDLENVTANMLAITYFAMYDWAQGVWIKDVSRPDGKWKIISWDFDFAFTNISRVKITPKPKNWEMDGFKVSMTQHDASLRSRLFNRLLKESPEYQKLFREKVDVLFNEVLTSEFLDRKFKHYEELAQDGIDPSELMKSIHQMKEFISHRKSFFCDQMLKNIKFQSPACLDENNSLTPGISKTSL